MSTRLKEAPPPSPAASLVREPHKYFDQVIVTVRSGDGGHGAILSMPPQQQQQRKKSDNKSKKKKNSFKRDFDGSLILPMGGHGGDVVIYADEDKDSLLEFHSKSRFNAKRGGNVDAMGVLNSQLRDGFAAPTLRIPVPVGLYLHLYAAKRFFSGCNNKISLFCLVVVSLCLQVQWSSTKEGSYWLI